MLRINCSETAQSRCTYAQSQMLVLVWHDCKQLVTDVMEGGNQNTAAGNSLHTHKSLTYCSIWNVQ